MDTFANPCNYQLACQPHCANYLHLHSTPSLSSRRHCDWLTLSEVRFQTCTLWPELSRFLTIPEPMTPRPSTPKRSSEGWMFFCFRAAEGCSTSSGGVSWRVCLLRRESHHRVSGQQLLIFGFCIFASSFFEDSSPVSMTLFNSNYGKCRYEYAVGKSMNRIGVLCHLTKDWRVIYRP